MIQSVNNSPVSFSDRSEDVLSFLNGEMVGYMLMHLFIVLC